MTHFCRLFSLQFQSILLVGPEEEKAATLNGKYISGDHLPCSFKNIYGWGGGHKDNFPSSPPLRSITQRWSLHRAGRLATWHPSSPPSPGNETCDRNQPATSRLPPSSPSPPPCSVLYCSAPTLVSAAFARSLFSIQAPRRKCTYAGTHL